MEEAAAVRNAALKAVSDIEPNRLRERITEHVADGSMVPGVLAVLSAKATRNQLAEDGQSQPHQGVLERGAGVQLIYDGLRLTRTLAHEEPWANGDATTADVGILVADILVARGFYLLARTDAAGAAVETVRSFGRDQTTRRETGDARLDHNLEADVFELAVVAGTTASGGRASPQLRDYVTGLARGEEAFARSNGHLAGADGVFSDRVVERLATLTSGTASGETLSPTTENRNA